MLTRFKNIDYSKIQNIFVNSSPIVTVIYFAASDIKLIRLVADADEQEILEAYTLELPADLQHFAWVQQTAQLVDFIKNTVHHKAFSAIDTIAVLDSNLVCIKELKMPVLSEAELAQAIKWDAVQYLPYQDGEYVYDYIAHSWSSIQGEGLKVNLIAAEKKVADAIVSICNSLELQLVKLTVDTLTIRELIKTGYMNFATIDIHDSYTNVTVFEDLYPVQYETIQIGRAAFIEMLANGLTISTTKARVLLQDEDELKRIVAEHKDLANALMGGLSSLVSQSSLAIEKYLFDKQMLAVEAIIIVGSLRGLNPQLQSCISAQIGTHAEFIGSLQDVVLADIVNISMQNEDVAIASGVAILLANKDRFSLVRFNNVTKNSRKLLKILAAICLCALVGQCIYEFTVLHSYQQEHERLSANYEQIAVWRKRSEFLQSLEADCLARETAISKLQNSRTAWPQILLALGYNIPDGVSITSIARVRDEDAYILRGKTDNINSLSAFINILHKTNSFKIITLQQVSESTSASQSQDFSINLKGMGRNDVQMEETAGL